MYRMIQSAISFLIVVFLFGCASTQNQIPSEIVTKVSVKQTPKLSESDKTILRNNGFSSGVWSTDCKDVKVDKFRYYELNDEYLLEIYLDSKVQNKGVFYEVKSISNTLIEVKIQSTNLIDNVQSITKLRSGFVNGKRLTIDSYSLFIDGKSAGSEVTTIKEGFNVIQKADGSVDKKSPIKPQTKCK